MFPSHLLQETMFGTRQAMKFLDGGALHFFRLYGSPPPAYESLIVLPGFRA